MPFSCRLTLIQSGRIITFDLKLINFHLSVFKGIPLLTPSKHEQSISYDVNKN